MIWKYDTRKGPWLVRAFGLVLRRWSIAITIGRK